MDNESAKEYLLVYCCGLTDTEIIGLIKDRYDPRIVKIEEKNLLATITIDKNEINDVDKSVFIANLLGPISSYIYNYNEYKTLQSCIIDYASLLNLKIGIAEYNTNGKLTYMLCLSDLDKNYVVESKIARNEYSLAKTFCVDESLIEHDTPVSANCVYQMANNLLNDNVNIAIAISGHYTTVPPRRGLVFIAVGNKEKIDVHRCRFDGSNEQILEKSINKAMLYLLKKIRGDFDIKEI